MKDSKFGLLVGGSKYNFPLETHGSLKELCDKMIDMSKKQSYLSKMYSKRKITKLNLWKLQKNRTIEVFKWVKLSNHPQARRIKTIINLDHEPEILDSLDLVPVCYIMFVPGMLGTEYIGETTCVMKRYFSRRKEWISLQNKRKKNLKKMEKQLLIWGMKRFVLIPFYVGNKNDFNKQERLIVEQSAIKFFNPILNTNINMDN